MENDNSKLPYEEMKVLYELAYMSAMNTLFKANFDKHNWRYDDFMEQYSAEEDLIDFAIDPHATLH
jgi:hypothetical protein